MDPLRFAMRIFVSVDTITLRLSCWVATSQQALGSPCIEKPLGLGSTSPTSLSPWWDSGESYRKSRLRGGLLRKDRVASQESGCRRSSGAVPSHGWARLSRLPEDSLHRGDPFYVRRPASNIAADGRFDRPKARIARSELLQYRNIHGTMPTPCCRSH